MTGLLPSGVGIGWRPEICGLIAELDRPAFAEVIAESLGRAVPDELADLLASGVPVVPHGIGLSLGSADGIDPARVSHLARCAELVSAPLVSEHIAFVRGGGLEAGHLLPLPRTREALDVVVRNIARTQDGLPVPLAVENIAALFDWPDAEFTEAEFLTELLDRTGVYLLLDVANVYANARNRGRDPAVELARLPIERVAYCHVAGGHVADDRYHDTHTDPVPAEVLALVTAVAERTTATAGPVPFLLERDGNYPPRAQLFAELDAIADAAGRRRVTPGSVAVIG
ncbi:DUF692 domain-containing protein [Skermania piniformis]|uniref:DUF692 domain-containing protein n=1 Tax=Skermania pinensis TaxID=39122 RepID=A0ABX8S9N6_9ACTN|nr:DUF692 domain-containing protein [Skermania piniformis]QXQ13887.1 DUF692 domain-containing protein [Skermania piniformis]